MQARYVVLTAIGPDRPGIVKEVSEALHAAGLNLEDSRMALLAGQFALMVLFSGSEEGIERFSATAPALREKLDFDIHLTAAEKAEAASDTAGPYALRISGVDQPGIVHRVSEILAHHRVNVLSMDSTVSHAAFTGTAIFSLRADLALPDPSLEAPIRTELAQACDTLNLALNLEPMGQSNPKP